MRTQIDLKRMRYIVEVARAEAITTAAQTLSLTQPALTRSIADVEDSLGTKLFHRLPRGVQLTDAGERFVTRARQILGDVDDLMSEMLAAPNTLTGRLRIGVAPAGYLNYASPALRRLAGSQPGIKVEIAGGTTQTLGPRLLRGELHAIVGSSSYLRRWPELEIRMLNPLHFGCMFRQDHPIAQLARPDELDILKYPVVLPASVEPTFSDIAQRHIEHGLPPLQPQYVTDDFELIKTLVTVTDSYHPTLHLLPSFGELADEFLILKDVIRIPEHQISVAFSSAQPKSEELELFEELLLQSHERLRQRLQQVS